MYTLPFENVFKQVIMKLRETSNASEETKIQTLRWIVETGLKMDAAITAALKRMSEESGYSKKLQAYIEKYGRASTEEEILAFERFQEEHEPKEIGIHDFRNSLGMMLLVGAYLAYKKGKNLETIANEIEERINRIRVSPLSDLRSGRMSMDDYQRGLKIIEEEYAKLTRSFYSDIWSPPIS